MFVAKIFWVSMRILNFFLLQKIWTEKYVDLTFLQICGISRKKKQNSNKNYPKRFCRASLRPYDNGRVKRVTIPSGPKTFDGILSNESESERESAWSCKLKIVIYFFVKIKKINKSSQQNERISKKVKWNIQEKKLIKIRTNKPKKTRVINTNVEIAMKRYHFF